MDLEPPSATAPHGTELASRVAQRLDVPIVLVGMMGVGKSSLGRKLAAALGWGFVDADEAIEAAAHMSIPDIFATYGEAGFRDGERRVIARLMGAGDAAQGSGDDGTVASAPPPRVIATGGGAFVHPETRALILARGATVWLDASLDTLVERTARKDNRPLLRQGNPREILGRLKDERAPFYAQAHIHVTSGNGPHTRTLTQVLTGLADWLDARADARATPASSPTPTPPPTPTPTPLPTPTPATDAS